MIKIDKNKVILYIYLNLVYIFVPSLVLLGFLLLILSTTMCIICGFSKLPIEFTHLPLELFPSIFPIRFLTNWMSMLRILVRVLKLLVLEKVPRACWGIHVLFVLLSTNEQFLKGLSQLFTLIQRILSFVNSMIGRRIL